MRTVLPVLIGVSIVFWLGLLIFRRQPMIFEYDHCKLVRVIDGDTIVVDIDLGMHVHANDVHVRLLNIDCPERNTPEGQAAKARVQELLPAGTPVFLSSAKLDKYGRMLCTVEFSVDGPEPINLNDLLLEEGHVKLRPPITSS